MQSNAVVHGFVELVECGVTGALDSDPMKGSLAEMGDSRNGGRC